MAGGNPLEQINVFGLKVPRYKIPLYFISGLFVTYVAKSRYNMFFKPTPPTVLDPSEKEFVTSYIENYHKNKHIPRWIRGDRDVVVGAH